jgi:hypothetical protein
MLKNELLQKAQAKIDEGAGNRQALDRLVKAGTKIIYDKATFEKLSEGIAQSPTPVEDVAKGMVMVLNMMAQRARGTIPHDALLQAGMTLLLDALDFMEQAGLVKVDNAVLDTATTEFIEGLLPTLGLTKEKLAGKLSELEQAMSDPQKMAQLKASAGGAK